MTIYWLPVLPSSELRAELGFKRLDETLHEVVDLFVVEGFFGVLQHEADGIGFFPFRQVLTFVHIEQIDRFQEFAVRVECRFFDLGELDGLVDE